MLLALETGWTPDVIADLPARFADACRWALYARSLAGDGLPAEGVPAGASPEVKMAAVRRTAAVAAIRSAIFPEGD